MSRLPAHRPLDEACRGGVDLQEQGSLPPAVDSRRQAGKAGRVRRLMLEGPDWDGSWSEDEWVPTPLRISWHRPSWGHGGDEYGNCSLYLRTPLFGVTWFYPTGHYQQDVELPEPGECRWADRVFYGED